ncbi:hypothetical protein J9J85_004484, partial [Salmonella enterica]|nr:hypothetical protein [Salmonella enterica]
PKVASIRRKSKATACCYRADHHYEYDEFGNPIADRWGKAQCREHRFEWNGEHRLVRFTDVRHYDDEGFPRHSWRYEFDNGVTTLYPCLTRKSSVSSLLITPLS